MKSNLSKRNCEMQFLEKLHLDLQFSSIQFSHSDCLLTLYYNFMFYNGKFF